MWHPYLVYYVLCHLNVCVICTCLSCYIYVNCLSNQICLIFAWSLVIQVINTGKGAHRVSVESVVVFRLHRTPRSGCYATVVKPTGLGYQCHGIYLLCIALDAVHMTVMGMVIRMSLATDPGECVGWPCMCTLPIFYKRDVCHISGLTFDWLGWNISYTATLSVGTRQVSRSS